MRNQSADRILFYALVLLLLWLPLPMGSNRAWAWAIMDMTVQLLAIAWLFLALQGRVSITPAFRRAKLPLMLFVSWLAFLLLQITPLPLSWVEVLSASAAETHRSVSGLAGDFQGSLYTLSIDPWASQSFLLKSWSYFLLFCLLLLLVRTTDRIRILVMALVLSGVFQALFGSFMVLSGIERLLFEAKEGFIGNATGTFVNRNHLAGYLNMCLALGIGWLVAGGRNRQALHWRQRLRNLLHFLLSGTFRLRLLLIFMAIALVMTHSRMGNTAFFSSLLITGAAWLIIRRQQSKRKAVIILSSILILDIAILGHWFGLDKVVERLQNTSEQSETRDDVVRESIPYLEAYSLTGSGAGSFYSTYPRYMGEGSRLSYRYAHNDYLQLFLETGAIGFLVLGFLTMASVVNALRAMANRHHPYLRGIGFGSFMGIVAILIHSFVDFNLQIPANAALFVTLLALASIAKGFSRHTAAATRADE